MNNREFGTQQAIEISIRETAIRVSPASKTVRRLLTTKKHVVVTSSAGTIVVQRPERHYLIADQRAILAPHGALPILRSGLDRAGKNYRISRSAEVSVEDKVPSSGRGIRHFLRAHPFGTVEYGGFASLVACLAGLCDGDDHDRIAVAVPNRRLAVRLESRLRTMGYARQFASGRMQINTPARLKNPEWCDLCLLIDAHKFRTAVALGPYRHSWRARRFALIPASLCQPIAERDRLAVLFGFHRFHLVGMQQQLRDICVRWEIVWGGARITASSKHTLSILREAIWRNQMRNRRIATLANSFASPSAVVVLVETLEHAHELAKRLLGWSVIAAAGNGDISSTSTTGRIVTAAAAEQLDWSDVDTIVRADAGIGLPASSRIAGPVPLEHNRKLLILDFDDSRLHPALGVRFRQRRAAYREQDWAGENQDIIQMRIDAYLDRRMGR